MFVDSDDVISKTMIMEHVDVIKKNNYKMVASTFVQSKSQLECDDRKTVNEKDTIDVLNSIFKAH